MWNQKSSPGPCEQYQAMLEGSGEKPVLTGTLQAHVAECAQCREAASSVALSRTLLRSGLASVGAPGPYFATRVMAQIRAEEDRRAAQGMVFWRPLEHLAARVTIVAATIVMALSFYVFALAPQVSDQTATATTQTYELVPHQQLDPQPQTKDEVLMSLVEATNGR